MSADRVSQVAGVELEHTRRASMGDLQMDPRMDPRSSREWAAASRLREVRTTVTEANRAMEAFDIQAKFSVHRATGQIVVRLENRRTGELIREIPPEKLLDLVAKMREMMGRFVDDRA
ncbi:MAG: flagellar protein FlaG [Firmicutes bacterium]|nr:flagellar protein FlaG [Bacillota bacterium]